MTIANRGTGEEEGDEREGAEEEGEEDDGPVRTLSAMTSGVGRPQAMKQEGALGKMRLGGLDRMPTVSCGDVRVEGLARKKPFRCPFAERTTFVTSRTSTGDPIGFERKSDIIRYL
jgi:hypothetical protein